MYQNLCFKNIVFNFKIENLKKNNKNTDQIARNFFDSNLNFQDEN